MKIGKKIKKLRLEQEITQERLADYLNISFQAISKWENEATMPDIKLLKPISNYFGVTIDYLLDNENQKEEVFISNFQKQYKDFNNQGKVSESIGLAREGLMVYPKNYVLMSKLIQSLLTITKSTHEHDMEQNANEVLKLCEIIIEDSNDYGLIDNAIRSKFYAYIDLKDFSKAIDIANQRPSIWHSKEILLTSAYRGEEANEYLQKTIFSLMDLIAMYTFSLTYKRYGSNKYSIKEKIKITRTSIGLIELILYDENYLFYSVKLRRYYTFLGIYYAELGNKEEMYKSLEKAKSLAIHYDSLKLNENYTSIIVNTQEHVVNETSVNTEWADLYIFKSRLERKEFNLYRDEDNFKKLFI